MKRSTSQGFQRMQRSNRKTAKDEQPCPERGNIRPGTQPSPYIAPSPRTTRSVLVHFDVARGKTSLSKQPYHEKDRHGDLQACDTLYRVQRLVAGNRSFEVNEPFIYESKSKSTTVYGMFVLSRKSESHAAGDPGDMPHES